MNSNNLNKSAFNYLTKNKDTQYNIIVAFVLGLTIAFILQTKVMIEKGENYQLFTMYILILGISLLQENSMVVDLTFKDKLSKRLEFFLGSGFKVEDIIKSYSLQMFRISGVIPFLIFMFNIYKINWNIGLIQLSLVYLSTVIFAYCEVLLLNTYVLTVKRYKLFKNILFFGNFILIYFSTGFAPVLINIIEKYSLSLPIVIISFNVLLSLISILLVAKKFKNINNQIIISSESIWV